MNRRLPSLRGGMNSLPMPRPSWATRPHPEVSRRVTQVRGSPKARMRAAPRIIAAAPSTVLRQRRADDSSGS